MGPPSEDGGNALVAGVVGRSYNSFNGAAVRRRRKWCLFVPAVQVPDALQWGRRPKTAEIGLIAKAKKGDTNALQWGRRPKTAEMPLLQR